MKIKLSNKEKKIVIIELFNEKWSKFKSDDVSFGSWK
jgi:hypothetical protein